ncbi:MAG: TasA family protein [Acutalibacteraceae bacterium]
MTKGKSTKKALLGSVTALVLSCSMLVGTTFAWFTDTEKSGGNTITAGNLNIKVEHAGNAIGAGTDLADDSTAWSDVRGAINLFKPVVDTSDDDTKAAAGTNTLWEPGHVEVAYLKVSNIGSLALKYNMSVNVENEIKSIVMESKTAENPEGTELALSNYVQYAVVDMPEAEDGTVKTFANRAAAVKAAQDTLGKTLVDDTYVQNVQWVKDASTTQDRTNLVLAPKNEKITVGTTDNTDVKYVAVVVWMPTTIENEANYEPGETAPSFDLVVNVAATQYQFEQDSFNKNYDDNNKVADDTLNGAGTAEPTIPAVLP